MTQQLTPSLKKKVQFFTALTVLTGVLVEIGKRTGIEQNPAANECISYMDKQLAAMSEADRNRVVHRLQELRVRIAKRTKNIDISAALVGAIDCISEVFTAKPGTEAAFIIDTFKRNRKALAAGLSISEDQRKKFCAEMKSVLSK